MSEITKLYRNAGVEQTQDITCGDCEFVNYPEENKPCNACTQYGIKHYPPFTAEKVIRLLEWEANRGIIDIKHSQKGYQIFTYIHTGNYGKSIIDAVASYFCVKWQDLTEEEKQQIKEILE